MHYTLHYTTDTGLGRVTQVRLFGALDEALDYALKLQCQGYSPYALLNEEGEEVRLEPLIDRARPYAFH